MSITVKICGLKDPETVAASVEAGAEFLGFNFFNKSPRYVAPEEAARLAAGLAPGVTVVAVVVDPDDAFLGALNEVLGPDIIQLHGTESPERAAEIRRRFGRPVMKALPVEGPEDVRAAALYEGAADRLLFDARPPEDGLPGGNARAFDWHLLEGFESRTPWVLSGGLTPENVGEAIRRSGAQAVDVSSGVERAPGRKDPGLIAAFVRAAKSLEEAAAS